jgi:hypothetical protein
MGLAGERQDERCRLELTSAGYMAATDVCMGLAPVCFPSEALIRAESGEEALRPRVQGLLRPLDLDVVRVFGRCSCAQQTGDHPRGRWGSEHHRP